MSETVPIRQITVPSPQGDDDRPSRGRPRDIEKNNAIVEAASLLFLEQGFDGTSMDEVAKRAGVSKQTVYSHFAGKEQLFSHVIKVTIEEYYPDAALATVEHHTLETDLLAVAETYVRLLMSDKAIGMHRVLVAAAPKGPEFAQMFWQAGPEEMTIKLCEFLQSWVDKGELAITDLEKAGGRFITLLKGKLHFSLEIGLISSVSEQELKDQARDAVDCFLKIYRA
ncbi:TetR/AcrR family transcriptional regulator [Kordiimonas sp.]|uniref:TetR/AcrR family transcriptional regulator n=1 Tax=Kordiimonas sp. TaxID=1970157 RepID=UPI003A92E3CB